MMNKGILLLAGLAVLSSVPAMAEEPRPSAPYERVKTMIGDFPASAQHANTVRVSSNISYFVPLPDGNDEAAEKEREKARKAIYDMASRECARLLETLAKECRLVNLNSNIAATRPYPPNQQNGFTVTGSMMFQIVPK